MKVSLSIVTPIYKDSYLAGGFIKSVIEFIAKLGFLSFYEVIFVIDGSGKNDEIELKKIAQEHSFVRVIILSRNFGQHIALSAGYKLASGDYVCMLNVDEQDPVSEIPKVLQHILKHKLDIVYGLRNTRKDAFFTRISSIIFNYVLNKLTGSKTPLNVATLRIMSRSFIDSYNGLEESARYLPGLENWLGFEKDFIEIVHQERKEGKSSYNFKKRLLMAIESIVSFSDLPLKFIAILGGILSIAGLFSLLFLIVAKLFLINFAPGYASTISIIIFVGGIQMMMLGFSSIYIGRILREVQNRPLYVIKQKINF